MANPPVWRTSARHWVAVYVAQLLNSLLLAPDVEVVISRLPEGLRRPQRESARDQLLQRLQCGSQRMGLRLGKQKVYVLGHHDISGHAELIGAAGPL